MRDFDAIMKDSPTVADVHVSSTGGIGGGKRRRRRGRPLMIANPPTGTARKTRAADTAFTIAVPITKIDDEAHVVYGWATVNAEGGKMITDTQGDQISDAEMTKAAHDFMASSRHGGLLHALRDDGAPHKGGEVVESLVLTADVQKALGVDLGKTGWFVGYHVDDPDAWALVKARKLRAFSIGGRAHRVPVAGA